MLQSAGLHTYVDSTPTLSALPGPLPASDNAHAGSAWDTPSPSQLRRSFCVFRVFNNLHRILWIHKQSVRKKSGVLVAGACSRSRSQSRSRGQSRDCVWVFLTLQAFAQPVLGPVRLFALVLLAFPCNPRANTLQDSCEFLINNSSFLITNSSFLMQNASFLPTRARST